MQIINAMPPASHKVALGYHSLALDCVVPVFTTLQAGERDVEALFSAAFNPLVLAVLEVCLDAGAPALFGFLRGLVLPPDPRTVTRFVDPKMAWILLDGLPMDQAGGAFDLRPGGGPELDQFASVSLCDAQTRMPYFYRQILPLVYAVLQGWGATVLVIPPPDADLAQAEAQWAALVGPGDSR